MVKTLTKVSKTVAKAKSIKTLKGWKTILFNGAALVPVALDVIGQLAHLPEIQNVIPPQYLPIYAVGTTLINIGLRYMTTSPVGKKV